jgi:hypothetical protein
MIQKSEQEYPEEADSGVMDDMDNGDNPDMLNDNPPTEVAQDGPVSESSSDSNDDEEDNYGMFIEKKMHQLDDKRMDLEKEEKKLRAESDQLFKDAELLINS